MVHTKELFSLKDKVAIVTGGRGLYGASISTGRSMRGLDCPHFNIDSRVINPAMWFKNT